MNADLRQRCTRLLDFIEDHLALALVTRGGPTPQHTESKGLDCTCVLCDFEVITKALDAQEKPDEKWLGASIVDMMFHWPSNRASKLAKAGKLKGYRLPDGSLAFKKSEILASIHPYEAEAQESKA